MTTFEQASAEIPGSTTGAPGRAGPSRLLHLATGRAEHLLTCWAGRARLSDPDSACARRSARILERGGQILRRRLYPRAAVQPVGALFPPQAGSGAGEPTWEYHDENWSRITRRWEHRRMLRRRTIPLVLEQPQQPAAGIALADHAISADVPADGAERWAYLFLDPRRHSWRNIRWSFTARRDSAFRELQFGFRYIDFYNRYRFRHEADHFHFDIVHNGVFYNDVGKAPCVMAPGRDYHIQIDVCDQRFHLAVDGETILDEVDALGLFPAGSVAIILWQNDGSTPIRTAIRDIHIEALALAALRPNAREIRAS